MASVHLCGGLAYCKFGGQSRTECRETRFFTYFDKAHFLPWNKQGIDFRLETEGLGNLAGQASAGLIRFKINLA